ncbi:MAG TPA: Hsp20/alpha crystallin family protein [Jatrophihabitans sp.]|nr:Hsp20/alpha crystallin family protein [Jatrophihabitans sp.]
MTIVKRDRRPAWPTETAWPEDRIDRVFRDVLRDFFAGGAMMDRFAGGIANPLHLEEFFSDGECVIRAEMPGIDPDRDIDITVSEGMLHLHAQRQARTEEERPDGFHSEFRYGEFRRAIRLPEGATETDVKASYQDGILEVRVPVPEPAGKTIKVAVEHG